MPSTPRKRGEKRRPDILRTVEAEAMPADALRALLRRTAEAYLPPRALEITRAVEAQEQQSILAMAATGPTSGAEAGSGPAPSGPDSREAGRADVRQRAGYAKVRHDRSAIGP